ncbi:sperm-associated antigen 16 protein isoform X1 [Oenanthe melanoleuca]|uniref:sperm-associated antigen 16 protein isoform X1 n=1 Tax=Oenanthe melanoleuca TaxID=2939378 RepID=UPI0024C100C1|nr:sperm-associated antigen 16 protein isoform X1 [Oenanthe melanoleuca]
MAEEEEAVSEAAFSLQNITITDEIKDDYQYEEVSADDDTSLHEDDEDLSKALQTIQEQTKDAQVLALQSVLTSGKSVAEIPQAMDDFFCNFLVRLGMSRTLDCFQTEWYELIERGVITVEDAGLVPNVYTRNQQLETENLSLKKDLETYKQSVTKTEEALQKMQRERDFHRMHHNRVVQEKNRLIADMKRLKAHYASYEPVLKQLSEKYQNSLTQKMLTSLERDKAMGQVTGLQAALESLESGYTKQIPETKVGHDCTRKKGFEGPTQKALQKARQQKFFVVASSSCDADEDAEKKMGRRDLKDSEFPVDAEGTPDLEQAKEPPQPLKPGQYQLSSILKVHDFAVCCLALHPRKKIVLSGGDDRLWKTWGFPDGNILLTGEGHTDYLSGCCFRPSGTQLVTSSGDSTVRIWDLSRRGCILTLRGHSRAVRGCCWHSCGDFVASASADGTARIWDVNSERCRYTLRGHEDSVNSIEFLPFSSTALTSSADKTLSLWDVRTGLRVYTFQGHVHPCNHATFNKNGDTIASCDSSGVLKLWDMRKLLPILSIDAGPHPANQVSFHRSGGLVALASSEGSVKVLCLAVGQLSILRGPGVEVRCVRFHSQEHLLSAGADGRVCIWTWAQ